MWAQNNKFLALLVTLVSMGPATPFNLAARPAVTRQITQLHSASFEDSVASSRRHALSAMGASLAAIPLQAFAAGAAPKLAEVTSFLKESREEISAIPKLLQAEKWDDVRTILKVKCGRLFALGEAQNPVVQFAKSSDEPELFELAEELGTALQLCDQYTYDNVFIYFQPGAGKVDIKNPTRQAEAALAKLGEIIDVLEGL